MTKYTVKLSGNKKDDLRILKDRFKRAMKDLDNFRPAMKKATVWLMRWNALNFRSEGGQLKGPKWKPFKAGGRKRKVGQRKTKTGRTVGVYKLDKTAKLLQDTGRLRASFFPFIENKGKSGGIRSDLDYAEVHQFGLGPVPQRRMLPEDDEVSKPLKQIMEAHVKSTLEVLK